MIKLASRRLKASREEILDALQGELSASHRFVLDELMRHIEEIEARINNLPFVAESLVVDRQGGLVALVFPDAEWIDKHHHDKAHLDKYLAHALKHLNNELADYQKISKFEIIDAEFEKTPKKSIKRFYKTERAILKRWV